MSRIPRWFSGHVAALRALLVFTVLTGILYPLAILAVAQMPGLKHHADGSLITDDGDVVGAELIGQSFTDEDGSPLREYFQSRPSAAGDGYDPLSTSASNLGPENIVDVLPDPSLGWDGDENASTSLLTQVCQRSATVAETEGVDGSRPYCADSGDSAVGAVLGVYYSDGLSGDVERVISLNEQCGTVEKPFVTSYEGVTVECAEYGEDHGKAVPTPIRGDAPADPVVPADAVTASASGLDPHISVDYARLQTARVADERGTTVERIEVLVKAHTTGGVLGEPGVNVVTLNLALDRDFPVAS
ncbi:potassium-transporting ATPase subunit C [Stackebrandtia soli]|uniref:potassium-transporting ATPase subunit C n=1 Tax=Stackebrandtia soli TaxID=1892856 RepID=UPI0039E93A1A